MSAIRQHAQLWNSKLELENPTFELGSLTFKLKFHHRKKKYTFHHLIAQFCSKKWQKYECYKKPNLLLCFVFTFFHFLGWNVLGILKSREYSKEHPCTYSKTLSNPNLLPYLLQIIVLKKEIILDVVWVSHAPLPSFICFPPSWEENIEATAFPD